MNRIQNHADIATGIFSSSEISDEKENIQTCYQETNMKKTIFLLVELCICCATISAQKLIGPTKVPIESLTVTKEYKLQYGNYSGGDASILILKIDKSNNCPTECWEYIIPFGDGTFSFTGTHRLNEFYTIGWFYEGGEVGWSDFALPYITEHKIYISFVNRLSLINGLGEPEPFDGTGTTASPRLEVLNE